ncbi:hypothetical protein E2562_012910 [Oryza meyeriana var. granulata]|uniref:Uncharacterized protein n=1 Tax=Oryza meyeriana var. granulata TaxID=110450 RepID=A0A6G1CG91_9ORYZ|nr:hypothetical protein E2562_012910 [Oryza meyeriana var. granulata]
MRAQGRSSARGHRERWWQRNVGCDRIARHRGQATARPCAALDDKLREMSDMKASSDRCRWRRRHKQTAVLFWLRKNVPLVKTKQAARRGIKRDLEDDHVEEVQQPSSERPRNKTKEAARRGTERDLGDDHANEVEHPSAKRPRNKDRKRIKTAVYNMCYGFSGLLSKFVRNFWSAKDEEADDYADEETNEDEDYVEDVESEDENKDDGNDDEVEDTANKEEGDIEGEIKVMLMTERRDGCQMLKKLKTAQKLPNAGNVPCFEQWHLLAILEL